MEVLVRKSKLKNSSITVLEFRTILYNPKTKKEDWLYISHYLTNEQLENSGFNVELHRRLESTLEFKRIAKLNGLWGPYDND